jgi:hypothetical protein
MGISFYLLALLLIAMKRLRDANFSPFLSLLLFLPTLLTQLIVIFLCILPGSEDHNHYGPAPRPWGIGTYISAIIFLIGVPVVLLMYQDSLLSYIWELVPRKEGTT